MTLRRKLLILIAILPALLITIALLYLNFADLSGWRDTVARLASNAIGRELRINGEFEPEIGFTTRVVATDITLANADWSDDPQMVEVDRLDGRIDLLSIVFGPITIRDVKISGARVRFDLDSEDRFNWDLGSGEPGNGGGGDVELVISRASVNDLQLVYARPEGSPLEAALSNLEFTDDGTGMLDLELDGTIMGSPFDISGRLGTFIGLINAAAVEHDLSGHLGGIAFSSRGQIAALSTLDGINLRTQVHGPEVAEVGRFMNLPDLEDVPFQVDLGVKPAGGGSDLEVDVSVGESSAEITGTVDSLTKPRVLDVTVQASGPDVATIGALTGVEGLPREPFTVSGRVRWEGFPLTCENVEVHVGDNSLSAHGVVGEPPLMLGTDFTFNGEGPDISTLAALAGVSLPHDSFTVSGRLLRFETGIEVQEIAARVGQNTLAVNGNVGDPPEYAGTALTVHAEGPSLARFQDLAGTELPTLAFEIDGQLTQGEGAINLKSFRGRLGRNSFSVDGDLSTEDGFENTDLLLHVNGPDASEVAAIAEVSNVPAEPYSVEGRVRVLDSGYRVSGLAGSLGSLAVTADGFLAPPSSLLGSDLKIHIEDSHLSHAASIVGITGLPRDAFSVDTRVQIEESGYRLAEFDTILGDIEARIDGFVGTPPELVGTDLRIEARGPRLAALGPYLEQPHLPDAPFSVSGGVRMVDGAYGVNQVIIEVDHNRIAATGTVIPLNNLAGTDLEFDVSGPLLREVGHLVAGFAELPELPAEPYSVTGRVLIDDAGYELHDLEATLAAAVAKINGRVGMPPEFRGTDLTIEADGPNASLVSSVFGVTMPLPFQLTGRFERDDMGYRFHQVAARLGEYRAEFDGALGELPKLIGTDIELRASGPGTALIKEVAGLPKLPDQPFGIAGRFKGTPEQFTARDFKLNFGRSDIAGSFAVDITGKPAVQARLTAPMLDLRRLRERLEAEDTGTVEEAEPLPPVDQQFLIPDRPLRLAFLEAFDADVAVRINVLLLRAKQFHDVGFDVKLEGGRLEIDHLSATGRAEGSMSGDLVLEPVEDKYQLRSRLEMRQIRLDVPGAEVDRGQQPPIDLIVDLNSLGASPHGLASAVNGSLQLVIGKGVMDSKTLDLVTADVLLTLLKAFNPFAKEERATELQCGVMLLNFDNGLATLEPMAFQSDKMTLLGKGKIDLGTEKLDLEWVTKPRKGIGISASMVTNPYIKLGGTLSKPSVELKGMEAVAHTGVAVATMGLSLVAKGMFDRITAEKKVCKKALEEIENLARNTHEKSN
jgi:uncharacterized protein involved in outer membrane biogenesis